jgi:hypothetical protein
LLHHFGATYEDLTRTAETPALRRVFITLLDRINRLNHAASELPEIVRDRRLRLETAVIQNLAKRLANRLWRRDPIENRVKLSKADFISSALLSLQFLV